VGLITQSEFKVMIPEVQKFLRNQNIDLECGVPYAHNFGTQHIERGIRTNKELQMFALLYCLGNPNFKDFGFTKPEILSTWGELFNWALTVDNLKICPNVIGKTKY